LIIATAPAPAVFASILSSLLRFVAMRERKGPDPMLLVATCHYINGVRNRFAALVRKIETGTLRPPRPRPRAAPDAAAPPDGPPADAAAAGAALREPTLRRRRPPRPGPRLPRKFGWLIPLVPHEAAQMGTQLRNLLETNPGMKELLAAAPKEMGRLLRPFCRMLAMEVPEVLRLPEREKPARKPKPPRPRKPREKKVRWRMARMPPERGLIFY
jgi:hypothetical protein